MELRRRTILKSLLWRLIGIVWTWIGAYVIIRLVPDSKRNASLIATLIVIYHHSTRMVMYYVYERVWTAVGWGRESPDAGPPPPMTPKERLAWGLLTVVGVIFIFYLIIYVTPMLKK